MPQQSTIVLDDLGRPLHAFGREQRSASALHGRLGGGEQLGLGTHEPGPQPVGRLVERDRKRVRELLCVEADSHAGGDRTGGTMDRRPELAVVRSDKQGQTEASGHLVGGHLCDQRASGVLRGERLRYGYCRVTGVAHV